jgi:hypothetical protein
MDFTGTNGLRMARSSQQCRQNLGEDVGVFVGIEVSHVHTSGLKLPDLCGNFSDQLVAIEASQGGARGESGETGVKLFRVRRANGQQRIQRSGRGHGGSVHQYDMASNGKIWRRARLGHCILDRGAVGHQGGRRHDSAGVGFYDGAIHSPGQTEIIGVDDQLSHQESVAAAKETLSD